MPTPIDIVRTYLDNHYPLIIWPAIGDSKGPSKPDWPSQRATLEDYREGNRVGILTGTEVAPKRFLHDVDIDWAPGSHIAQKLLPPTNFIFGRSSKRLSHCFYLLGEAAPSSRYEDIDKSCFVELRGTKIDGTIGMQTMVPPSIWSKDGVREPLDFVKFGDPGLVELASELRQRVCLVAIGMILAKHLGKNGFGHEPRLAWAGFLLRAGVSIDELVTMGEAISMVTNNTEVHDVRRVVESTAERMTVAQQKVKGGPALAKIIGDNGKAVIDRINEWLGRDSDFLRNKDGLIIKDSQENIRRALTLLNIDLSHQVFSEKSQYVEKGGLRETWSDVLCERLWLRIDREFHFRPSQEFFKVVTLDIAYNNVYHPVLDYLNPLKWDGIPRVDTWLVKYGGSPDSEYHRTIASIALIAAVRRVKHPGCKYDEMLVLESEQGMNKSSALRALCSDEEWFSDDLPLNVDAKEIIERTLGKWIIEASDLVGGRKADRDHLKSMLSRQVDGPARMAWGRIPIERRRQFIVIGTTNSAEYLADPTGARRFWPSKVRNFDVINLIKDRDQLWAEAVAREEKGESIRLPERLWKVASEHQEERREVDAWEDTIEIFLNNISQTITGRRQVSTDQLWMELGVHEHARRDRTGMRRIAEIMQRLGYRRQTIKVEGEPMAGYVRDGDKGVLPSILGDE